MESAIRLCYSPIPSAPLLRLSNGPNRSAYPRSTIFHHTLNHASLCASHLPTVLDPVSTRSFFRHANCVADRLFSMPSNNDGNGGSDHNNKVVRGVTQISLVLACVLGLFNFKSNMNPMFKAAYACLDPGFGGKLALSSLLDTFKTEAKPNQTRPDPKEGVPALKKNYPEAGNRLDNILDEYVPDEEHRDTGPKQLTNVKDRIGELLESSDSDSFLEFGRKQIAQLLLYKAIVHTMLGDNKEAAEWWKGFGKIIGQN